MFTGVLLLYVERTFVVAVCSRGVLLFLCVFKGSVVIAVCSRGVLVLLCVHGSVVALC